MMMSPFASSIARMSQRAMPAQRSTGGLGALFGQRPLPEYDPSRDYNRTQPAQQLNQAPSQQSRSLGSALDPSNTPQFDDDAFNTFMGGLDRGQRDMINMFAGRQVQQQMQQMMQQRQMQPRMGMGIGGMNPMGMQPYQQFGRPPMMQQPQRQFGAMMGGYNQPRYQPQPMQYQQPMQYGGYQQNPYQQPRPQPQQFGGYGMGQQMGGYGGYGGMSNPYQPQQFGYNPNSYQGYGQGQTQY